MRKIINNIKIIDERNTFKRRHLRKEGTPAEKKLWYWLRKEFSADKWRRQHNLGHYIADFYCHERKLVIELDGHHHDAGKQYEYDELRTDFLINNQISVLRFSNEKVLSNLSEVIDKIRIFNNH